MRSRRFLVLSGASLLTLAVPASAVFAQRRRRGDDGQYQILEARYGVAQGNVDVTDRLKQLARRDRLVKIENDLFGVDPAYGIVKTLRIYARDRTGALVTFEYREGDYIDGAQFTGWGGGNWGRRRRNGGWGRDGDRADRAHRGGLQIARATYGIGRQSRDVTDRVRSLVRGDQLDIQVDNQTFGIDPAPGIRKFLDIVYSWNGRTQQEMRVREEDRLSIP